MLSLLLSTPGFYIYVAFLVVVLLAALWVEKPQRLRCTRGPRLAARRSRVAEVRAAARSESRGG